MRKYFLLILVFVIGISACVKKIDIITNIKTTDAPTIAINTDKVSVFNYQGFVDISIISDVSISEIELKDINYPENKYGLVTLHKAGNDFFKPDDVKNIKNEIKAGITYNNVLFSRNDINVSSKTNIIRLQYLILDVKPETKKKDLKNKISAKLECKNDNGNIIATKVIEISIP